MPILLSRRAFLLASAGTVLVLALPHRVRAADEQGGRLTVAADSEPTNLNPAIVASNGVFFVASKVIEQLAEADYNAPDRLAPKLAVSWEGSPDGKAVTFKLRPNVKWHDGKPFTSADVAFSALEVWKKLQNLGRVVFKDLESVDTPDDLTAVLHFAAPTPFQLIRNCLPALTSVLPKHVFEGTDIMKNPANEKLIGTGPFKYVEHKPGEYYLLRRNDAYWVPGEPKINEILFKVLPDRDSAGAALEAGEIQLAAFSAVPLADLDRISKVSGLKVYAN
ncbi:MAG: ABC transporter substrate-binding protein, partial [Bradyrhizobium sp.]